MKKFWIERVINMLSVALHKTYFMSYKASMMNFPILLDILESDVSISILKYMSLIFFSLFFLSSHENEMEIKTTPHNDFITNKQGLNLKLIR